MPKKQMQLEAQAMAYNMTFGVLYYLQHQDEYDDVPDEEEYSFDMNDPLSKYIIP